MKSLLALMLALALCLSGAALADAEGPLFEARSIYGLDVNVTDCLKYTNYTNGYGIVSVAGEKLSEEAFGAISHAGHGYFEVINENGLETHGLVDRNGAELIPMHYSAFQVYSDKWVGAVVVTPTDDEDGDYSSGFFGGGEQYNIDHVDLWYLPENKVAGTLTRDQFKDARAVGQGEYVLVKDRSKGLTLYNAAFEAMDHLFESFDDAEIFIYQPNKLQAAKLYSRVTCQPISEDVPEGVETISYTGDYFALRKEVKSLTGSERRYALISADGKMLTDYVLGSVTRICDDRYVVSNIYDRETGRTLYGVYDLEAGKDLLPFAYERIRFIGDRIGYNGYFLVQCDDKQGFVDAGGNVTCPMDYNENNVEKDYGCCFTWRDGDRLLLVAADGVVTDLTEKGVVDTVYSQDGNDGRFVPVENADDKYAILDWHGNVIVDFVLEGLPEIYRDGYMVYDGGIYHLTL